MFDPELLSLCVEFRVRMKPKDSSMLERDATKIQITNTELSYYITALPYIVLGEMF